LSIDATHGIVVVFSNNYVLLHKSACAEKANFCSIMPKPKKGKSAPSKKEAAVPVTDGVYHGEESPQSAFLPPPLPALPCRLSQTAPIKDVDKKHYKLIHLKNGMRVLMIHEPSVEGAYDQEEAEDEEEEEEGDDSDFDDHDEDDEDGENNTPGGVRQAAIALAVGVGSFSDSAVRRTDVDPSGKEKLENDFFPGLAHFCEHMLFLGSDRYPDENELDSYLSEHGGYSNAFTEAEYTLYQVECGPEGLVGALDRLSSFLVAPKFSTSSVDREIRAIESEFQQVLTDDGTRHAELLAFVSQQNHPGHNFGWGNLDSLLGPVEERSPARTEALVAALREYFKRFYSPERMQLVIRCDFVEAVPDDDCEKIDPSEPETMFNCIEGYIRKYFESRMPTKKPASTPSAPTKVATPLGANELSASAAFAQLVSVCAVPVSGKKASGFAPLGAFHDAFVHLPKFDTIVEYTKHAVDDAETPSIVPSSSKKGRGLPGKGVLSTSLPSYSIALAPLVPAAAVNTSPAAVWVDAAKKCACGEGACHECSRPYVYLMEPTSTGNSITLVFNLPSSLRLYHHNPEEIIGHLVGHEGDGSILQALKHAGIGIELSAGVSSSGSDQNSACVTFTVDIELTDAGMTNLLDSWVADSNASVDPVEIVFSYITHVICGGLSPWAAVQQGIKASKEAAPVLITATPLRHPVALESLNKLTQQIVCDPTHSLAWVYDEMRHLSSFRYHYGEDDTEDVVESVTALASAMVLGASDAHVLTAHHLTGPFLPAVAAIEFSHLFPLNMRLVVVSSLWKLPKYASLVAPSCMKTDPWFKFDFATIVPSAACVQRWNNPAPSISYTCLQRTPSFRSLMSL
jgi:hypothetical protein